MKKIMAGMTMLVVAGTPSLHADIRSDLREEFGVSSMQEALPLIDEAKQGGRTSGWYFSGMKAMLDYNFPQAKKDFAEYQRLARKNGYSRYNSQVAEALQSLQECALQFDRFQDIVVIDAIEVDRDDFLKKLRLPLSAGRVTDSSEVPGDKSGRGEAAFFSESGDFMMWSRMKDVEPLDKEAIEDGLSDQDTSNDVEDDVMVMMEANLLADGTLSTPIVIEGLGDYPDFPFLTSDGTTLYFSAEGSNSAGGRDIFITTRDPQTGEYRAPVNAGFPFNSAADDYLIAIDEENGVGWWATDRHLLPDNKIVLYVFLLPEGRRNYEGADVDKRARGVLKDIRVTWQGNPEKDNASTEDADEDIDDGAPAIMSEEEIRAQQEAREQSYKKKAEEIRSIRPGQKPRRRECMIPIAPGKYICSEDEVSGEREKALVRKYIQAEKEYDELSKQLGALRRQYSSHPDVATGNKILSLESTEVSMRTELTRILSSLYKELKGK